MKDSLRRFRPLFSKFGILAIFVSYPTVFMYPYLFGQVRGVMTFPGSNGLSDNLGAVRVAQMLDGKINPLGLQHWTNFPRGESIWRLQNISQAAQTLILWLCGNATNPFIATAILTVLGWSISGAAVYWLGKNVGLATIWCCVAVLIAQAIPMMQFFSSGPISMIFSGLPLAVCALFLYYLQTERVSYLNAGVLLVVSTSIVDGYIFYFCLYVVIVFGIVCLLRCLSGKYRRRKGELSLLLPLLIPLSLHLSQQRRGIDPNNRNFLPASNDQLNTNGLKIREYLYPHLESPLRGRLPNVIDNPLPYRPSVSSIGFTLTVLCIFGLASIIRSRFIDRKWSPEALVVLMIGSFVLLSLKSTLHTPFGSLSNPAHIFRFLAPGAIYFDRSAVVAQLFGVVLAIKGLQFMVSRIVVDAMARIAAVLMVSLSLLELQPFSTRQILDESDDYQLVRERVSRSEGLLFVPESFYGRRWLQQALIERPMANSLWNPSERVTDTLSLTGVDAAKGECLFVRQGISALIVESTLLQTGSPYPFLEHLMKNERSEFSVRPYSQEKVEMSIVTLKC